MFSKKKKMEKNLLYQIEKLNYSLEQSKIVDLIELLGDTKKMLLKNMVSGIFKGIGIGIGVTLITAVIVYVLQKIITLNIPVISKYIADIVKIVEHNM